MQQVELQNVSECSLDEITELWNAGFWHDYSDTSQTTVQRLHRMARFHIDPELSIVIRVAGIPAGFILIGRRIIHGRTVTWNGGTGVVPAFRRHGLGNKLIKEAIQRVRAAGAYSFSLETRLTNEPAIRLYQNNGFQILDQLQTVNQKGHFEKLPFPLQKNNVFLAVRSIPAAVNRLPFYCEKLTSWTTQWFNLQEGQSIIVYDVSGSVIGYATFREYINEAGQLYAVELYHCEAAPDYSDARDVIHYMLSKIYRPEMSQLERKAHYIRTSNRPLVAALASAGFQLQLEEHLMEIVL